MFKPIYKLNNTLLNNLVRIKNLIAELNSTKFPDIILAKFEKDSYAISTYASTSIEGNPLPLTDVKRILKNRPAYVRDTEMEILNYNKALEYLNITLGKQETIDSQFICNIQGMVIDGLIDKKNHGKLRRDPVVVNNPKKREVVYIPPNSEDVPRLISELVEYLKIESNTTDPLLLAGIFHKQFVVIHPFMDGNGRSARLVTKYILAKMGLDTFNLFSFENYYNKDVTKYFNSVGVYGDYYDISVSIDFTDWLIYFTDGIIDELLRVKKLLQESIPANRIVDHEKIILDYINKNGSISENEYKGITNRARSTRILDFKRLREKHLIVKNYKGKSTYYTLE